MSDRERIVREHWTDEARRHGVTWDDDTSTEEIQRNVNAIREALDGDAIDREWDRLHDPYHDSPPIRELRLEAGGMTDE